MSLTTTHSSASASQQGFALMLVSILFAAFALIAAASLDRSNAMKQLARQDKTRAQMSLISVALTRYYIVHDRTYPCPGDPAIVPVGSSVANCYDTTLDDAGHSSIFGTQIAVLTGSSNEIIRGSIPVLLLGLDPDEAIDAWGNKIMYVVNRNLTAGGSKNASVLPNVYDYTTGKNYARPDYIVLSYGRDGIGAYGIHSTTISVACPMDGTLRAANCDQDINFVKAPLFTPPTATAATYFDDMLAFFGASCVNSSCT